MPGARRVLQRRRMPMRCLHRRRLPSRSPLPGGSGCCDDTCSPIGTCGQETGETCDDSEMSCCGGLTCCETPGGSWCGECCTNADCPGDCEICRLGACVSTCTEGEEC